MIQIKDKIEISESELVFTTSRSSGPGGQNVNKVNTRVTLFFDITGSQGFSEIQKARILKKLANRISRAGLIRVVSQRHRTQKANRNAAIERLVELLKAALKTNPPRKKTKVPFLEKQKRLQEKKQHGLLKKQRTSVSHSADND
jgi:ribosome-associated protein